MAKIDQAATVEEELQRSMKRVKVLCFFKHLFVRTLAIKHMLKSERCIFCNDKLNRNNNTIGA